MIEERRHSVDIPISRALVAIMRSRSLRDPDTNSLAKFSAKKTIWEGCSLEEDEPEGNNYGRHSFSYNAYDHLQRRREEFGDSMRSGRLANSPIDIIKANAMAKAALHNQSCCSAISGMSRAAKDRAFALVTEGEELGRREARTFQESSRSLLQKYRPKSFSELVGHDVVAQSLSGAVLKGKLAPIYLFHGPHGVGKTSAARIFAAALNCHSPGGNQPCGHCEECMAIFSGGSSTVIEVDASKLDCKSRVAALLRNACEVPASSHFKVLIVDDCQQMDKEGWYSIYNSLEGIPDSSIFVMITSDIDKLPSNSIGWCQSYRFCKIDDAQIARRLIKICTKEGMEFEAEALELLARKANGSIRDAIQMLDQLTLLGRRISKSVTHELIGDISDEELLDLLNLAMSSDAATIVRRARELLSSKVDPLQLLAQLANLIMDILAGKHPSDSSEVRRVTGKHTSADVDVHKLRNALEILSETEKQLKTTKNQSTWLTAALLQFNMREPYCLDDTAVSSMFTESHTDDGTAILKDESLDTSSHLCSLNKVGSLDMNLGDPDVLETIWMKALESCSSRPLQNLLRKDGKLSSLYTTQGVAVAELQFCHPEDVPTSESFWKPLCASLQNLLRCNVDIQINLSPISSRSAGSKDSSVSLVMQSREDREVQDPAATNCRTVVSSRRDCPSPLAAGQAKEKPSHILGCLHGTTDGDAADTESKILSYQKISAIPAASTPGNAPLKARGGIPKVEEDRDRHGCFSSFLPCGACALRRRSQPREKRRASLFSCCFCKIRPDCKTKAEAG
ncbi:protein STICHEL-like 2 [Phragmites australis]|uniref:protein STICHEL-like 2 n=1 Tax=Phragmites australis TaxID=29695 RepID=UPI002D767970|nr:protein STICHEL-like 2 [Phragmites australis]